MLTLKWADVDWENGRFRIHSPKTEHHPGKDTRVAPLFPELRAILDEAREAAAEGAVHVVSNDAYRAAADTPGGWRNCNLRTQFLRILKRAGLEPWPRLFHAMRASRETELVREHPIHVVTAWLGNTPQIAHEALPHGDGDGLLQSHRARLVEKAVQNPVQCTASGGANSGAAASRDDSHDLARNDISHCTPRAYAKRCEDFQESCENQRRRARDSNPQPVARHLISSQRSGFPNMLISHGLCEPRGLACTPVCFSFSPALLLTVFISSRSPMPYKGVRRAAAQPDTSDSPRL